MSTKHRSSLIELAALDAEFQAACQRYAHGNGSSMAIAAAALRAVGMPELLDAAEMARKFLHSAGHRQGDLPIILAQAIAKATGSAL